MVIPSHALPFHYLATRLSWIRISALVSSSKFRGNFKPCNFLLPTVHIPCPPTKSKSNYTMLRFSIFSEHKVLQDMWPEGQESITAVRWLVVCLQWSCRMRPMLDNQHLAPNACCMRSSSSSWRYHGLLYVDWQVTQRPATAGTLFKNSMLALVEKLKSKVIITLIFVKLNQSEQFNKLIDFCSLKQRPFYVRCIKPNDIKSSSLFDEKVVGNQVRMVFVSFCLYYFAPHYCRSTQCCAGYCTSQYRCTSCCSMFLLLLA